MHWESIGDCGSGQLPEDYDWIIWQKQWAIQYLLYSCGPPPEGCKLGLMWHEYELGDYPTIGLSWEIGRLGSEEWDYIHTCDRALSRLDRAVSWSDLRPEVLEDEDDEPDTSDAGELESSQSDELPE